MLRLTLECDSRMDVDVPVPRWFIIALLGEQARPTDECEVASAN